MCGVGDLEKGWAHCHHRSFPISHPGHFTLKMETALTSETMVSYHDTTWHCNPEDLNLKTSLP